MQPPLPPQQAPTQIPPSSDWPPTPPPIPYAAPPPAWAIVPAPPRVWTVFVAFVAAFVAAVIASLVVLFCALFVQGELQQIASPDDLNRQMEGLIQQPVVLLLTAIGTSLSLSAVALAGGWLSKAPLVERLRVGKPLLPWYGYIIAILGTLGISELSNVLIYLLDWHETGILHEIAQLVQRVSGWELVLAVVAIGLGAGVGEELLFRGYIQTRLTQRWGMLASIAIATVLFALLHMDPVQSLFVLLIGAYLGYLTEKAGSIWPAVVAHTVNNALSVILAHHGVELTLGIDLDNAAGAGTLLATAAAAIAIGVVYLVRRPTAPLPPAPVRMVPVPAHYPYTTMPPAPPVA